ncbi:MAG: hypothetical protein J5725_01925 [Bacteroidales bacterium]|nr:hypothetical protein [Bacteroidales bacterium]
MKTLLKIVIVVCLAIFLIPCLVILAGEIGIVSWFAGSDFGYIMLTIFFIILAIIFLVKAFS